MAEPFLGEIKAFGFNFPPNGWAQCNGQVMPISQNTALFSLLGTMYGGDGVTTFALPDLRGRVGVHAGQGAGLSNYSQGEVAGTESVTLTVGQLPVHSHNLVASTSSGNTADPSGAFLAKEATGVTAIYGNGVAGNATLAAGSVTGGGGGQPHSNLQPFLVLNFCIALNGIFPSRN